MTRIFLFFVSILFAFGQVACKGKTVPVPASVKTQVSDTFPTTFFIPAAQGRVNDFDSLFSARERVSLDSLITAYDTARIVIVTVDSTYFKYGEIEEFSTRLFNTWGIGDSATNNGILICICLNYRQLRIENGSGIEKIITNDETRKIIDTRILPRFKEGKFYDGVRSGINGLKEIISRKNH